MAFRCLVFRDGGTITLQSKFGKPLTRYFPDVAEAVRALKAKTFVLDAEIVVPEGKVFSFDALLSESIRRRAACGSPPRNRRRC
jgi:ATP-dependent DNA ligase